MISVRVLERGMLRSAYVFDVDGGCFTGQHQSRVQVGRDRIPPIMIIPIYMQDFLALDTEHTVAGSVIVALERRARAATLREHILSNLSRGGSASGGAYGGIHQQHTRA
jgi:hypothetical protein